MSISVLENKQIPNYRKGCEFIYPGVSIVSFFIRTIQKDESDHSSMYFDYDNLQIIAQGDDYFQSSKHHLLFVQNKQRDGTIKGLL